uniref:Uncharacterized protein n=1 Tax=Glossina austeni TaxID=7395 RepID=A0A1A9VYW3_GLOAU
MEREKKKKMKMKMEMKMKKARISFVRLHNAGVCGTSTAFAQWQSSKSSNRLYVAIMATVAAVTKLAPIMSLCSHNQAAVVHSSYPCEQFILFSITASREDFRSRFKLPIKPVANKAKSLRFYEAMVNAIFVKQVFIDLSPPMAWSTLTYSLLSEYYWIFPRSGLVAETKLFACT